LTSESAILVSISRDWPSHFAGDRVYVANYGSGDVSVVNTKVGDADFQQVVETIDIGEWPVAVAVHPDGRGLYVATARRRRGRGGGGNPETSSYTAKASIQTGSPPSP
jgi:YVTN family beta-propeller protein